MPRSIRLPVACAVGMDGKGYGDSLTLTPMRIATLDIGCNNSFVLTPVLIAALNVPVAAVIIDMPFTYLF